MPCRVVRRRQSQALETHGGMDLKRFDGANVRFLSTAEESGYRLLALDDELEARILAGKP